MNELQVIINEEPGNLTWNFEELKKEIGSQLAVYETTVYTDDNIADAKKDVAELRKLEKAVEDRRKEIKKRWMAPYELLEKQAKELVGLIEEPINTINTKVSEYELEERRKKEALVEAYYKKAMEGFPEGLQDALLKKKWDARWGLKSVSKKTWTEAIDGIVGSARAALTVIDGMEEEFREPCMGVYLNTLDLTDVLAKQREMQAQKERILEAERKRQEAEAERKEKERVAEAQSTPQEAPVPQARPKETETETFTKKTETAGDGEYVLRIKATSEQIAKIRGYIKFVGAEMF